MAPQKKSRARKTAGAVQSHSANVNGTRLHYLAAGGGEPIVLLHGYAETSYMWRPLIPKLAATHTVIAPDLRGAGQSATPPGGYTKAEMAKDIHALAQKLGFEKIRLVGHDIGLMVAYAYAAQYPNEVDRIVLMDAFLPGVGNWRDVWLMRDLWHFHFYGKTPLALVHGRERIYFEHFWNDFAANPARSVSERDRRIYAKAGRRRFCALCSDTVADAHAGSDGRKGLRRGPDSAGAPGCKECGGRGGSQFRTLADGRSSRTSDPEAGGVSESLDHSR